MTTNEQAPRVYDLWDRYARNVNLDELVKPKSPETSGQAFCRRSQPIETQISPDQLLCGLSRRPVTKHTANTVQYCYHCQYCQGIDP